MSNLSDPENIAANRQGRVSPQQREAFARRTRKAAPEFTLIFIVLLLGVPGFIASLVMLVILGAFRPPGFGGWVYIYLGMGAVLVGATLMLLREALRTREIQWELNEAQVEQAEGEVVWRQEKFVAEIPGRRLRSIYGEALNLPPGRYRFFFLPRTGGLIAGERLGSWDAAQARLKLLSALAQTNKFKVEALQANRAGQFADSQTAELRTSLAWHFVGGLAMAGVIVALGLLASVTSQPLNPVVFLILLTPLTIYVFWQAFKRAADVRAGQVAVVEGNIHKMIIPGRSSTYYYSIQGLRFQVSREAYNALIKGIPYRLYYAPRSKTLVAIEPIG